MPNKRPQNAEHTQFRSGAEAVENGRKGGIASGEARRKRKTLKEELLLMLSDGDIQEKISLALINEAIKGNNAGSVTKAFEVIRDTIGEKPADKVETKQTVLDMSKFSTEELKAMLDDDITE